ncbi:MAG: 2Fe-2S iron-sulfur cluster-binding protein [Pseudomonas sp.]|uniref:2Fe-2S iron-sulfur cluster-binding protein n=1 Tax=Pseudomonas sp. TaxID=306 RepID=UPI003D6EFB33
MRSHDFVPLTVKQVVRETEDAVSLVLDVPFESLADFDYQPGQFLTVRCEMSGKWVKRCYSLSSSPHSDDRHVITIKRVAGGRVSNALCSDLRAGDVLECLPPSGMFVPKSLDGDFLLFAGGSGVTPVLSIAKSVLAQGAGKVLLIYANRDENSVIFRDVLRALVSEYPERMAVVHWQESLLGLPTKSNLALLSKGWLSAQVFVCGPTPFMVNVTQALDGLGVDSARIHVEKFVSLPDEEVLPTESISKGEGETLSVLLSLELDGTEHQLQWREGEKMLDALLAAGIDAPYSCRVGGCSTCMCLVTSGKVEMANNLVLDARELAEGWVLSCQALSTGTPVSAVVPT